ncbi:hypothetical protein BLNAU_17485 [Blattamonas nauphoetae]|uniref:Uncharacterized protein n=1 Tax=Blattamonas nauphoetae TaxID=2049346 RepID=A0ABQ9X8Q4_9EUKA|nr:hypothetical protein BLNAU_17485 [Blattamonas nauphoetae]
MRVERDPLTSHTGGRSNSHLFPSSLHMSLGREDWTTSHYYTHSSIEQDSGHISNGSHTNKHKIACGILINKRPLALTSHSDILNPHSPSLIQHIHTLIVSIHPTLVWT